VCTTNDACLAGVCGGDPLSCDDGDDCTEDLCHQVEGCAYEPKPEDSPCDDQDACTLEDLCQLGACVSTGGVLECFDDDACTSDLCDVELGCAFATEPACLPPTAWPVINEIDSDQEGVDSSDFIELLIVGDQEADLTLYTVVLIDGTSGVPYNIINLSKAGELATAGTRIVIGPPSIANAPSESALGVVTVGDFLQSGGGDGDAIEIMRNGTEFIDTVSYGGVVESAAEGEGHAGVDAGLPDSPISLGRCPDGTDEDDNALDFAPGSPTPGLVNDCSG